MLSTNAKKRLLTSRKKVTLHDELTELKGYLDLVGEKATAKTIRKRHSATSRSQDLMQRSLGGISRIIRSSTAMAKSKQAVRVKPGNRVEVRFHSTGSLHTYQLVGAFEANPGAGKLSNLSPFGRSLIGKRVGELALSETGKHQSVCEIVRIF